jgi:hypothetical protein
MVDLEQIEARSARRDAQAGLQMKWLWIGFCLVFGALLAYAGFIALMALIFMTAVS